MPESGDLLISCLTLCVIGAATAFLAPSRLVFIGFVAAQCLTALAAAAAVLAGGAAIKLPLWQLSSFGRLLLVLDPIAALFLAVTAIVFGIGVAFAVKDAARFRQRASAAAFYGLYQLLLGAIVLVLAAGDIVSFVVGWELMSLLIFALVTFDHAAAGVGRAGYVMLALSEAGTIAGLIGLLLLAGAAGGIDFDALRGLTGLDGGLRWAVFLLTFFGFGVKAGLLPVNQWLPDAYVAAPRGFTPVLAGATTNLGIYAILRINADLLPPNSLGPGLVVLVIGSLTALVGILYATIQTDLRRVLAHSSIENMGIVVAALGAGLVFAAAGENVIAGMALIAALYHLVNHAFYKALLFTGAGAVDDRVGSTDMDRLGGLIHRMPWTAGLFLIGVLAIAALPPLNGFVSEWLTLQTLLRASLLSSTVVKIAFALSGALLALTAGLAVTCFAKAFAMSFLGIARSSAAAGVKDGRTGARGPMAALAVLCVLLGILPTYVVPALDRTVTPIVHTSAGPALVPPFFLPQLAEQEGIAPGFLAEFHDLGAQVGRGTLPGRGLVVLHRGGAANPVVFAMSTSYTVLMLAVLLALTWILFRLVTLGRARLRRAAWDGGLRCLRPGITYTATGFSNPVRVVFHALLRPATIEDSTEAIALHFRTAVRREYDEAHLLDRLVLTPAVASLRRVANVLRRMHIGQVNAYAGYVLLALLLALVVGISTL
jgi:hydrogenase-4 component B